MDDSSGTARTSLPCPSWGITRIFCWLMGCNPLWCWGNVCCCQSTGCCCCWCCCCCCCCCMGGGGCCCSWSCWVSIIAGSTTTRWLGVPVAADFMKPPPQVFSIITRALLITSSPSGSCVRVYVFVRCYTSTSSRRRPQPLARIYLTIDIHYNCIYWRT